VDDGSLLIATRFIKGVSAAFTAPAGLSIITTSFAEGPVRNKAIAIYTATGATGFSLGLVFGGLLTEIGWRWVFFLPVPIALLTLLAGIKLVPSDSHIPRPSRSFDLAGAVTLTAGMLLLVFTVVEAPSAGWASARTLGSFAAVAAIFAGFVAIERRTAAPLVRLGILRSASIVQANLGAMMLVGGWFGFQFIATLYMQQLRGWSPLETGLAIFPGGLLVALLAPRIAPLVLRFGVRRLVTTGLASTAVGYALFLPIGLDSPYVAAILPTMIFAGFGFALAYGPLNIAATNGVAAEEQGLASGLVSTSFQFGGALVLAVVTAVNAANTGADGSAQGLLDGFQAAVVVSVIAAVIGVLVTAVRFRTRTEPAADVVEVGPARDAEPEAEAA
jgi:predicted MFS family arabinose efflux permease